MEYIVRSYAVIPSYDGTPFLCNLGVSPWVHSGTPAPVTVKFRKNWGRICVREIEHAFPVSQAWWECYFRHGSVNGRELWRKPMRRRADGQWLPNRHQRKHGCYALDTGKGVC